MTIEIIKGPLTEAPSWSPATVTFVRTKYGLRELGQPRVSGSFGDQVSAWARDKAFGGAPQYWQVVVGEHPHPEVKFELFGYGGILKFDIRLNFGVRVVSARRVLEQNIRTLNGYFTQALCDRISPIAIRYDMAHSHELQHEIGDEIGGGNKFGNDTAETFHLTVQVQPADPAAFENMKKLALVPTRKSAIQADVQVTQAEMEAFYQKTGSMTIDALARVAIATGNPQLIDAYNNLRKLHVEEGERNWERLKFLIDSKLIEPHDLEKHLGPLGEDVIRSLLSRASVLPSAPPVQIGKS